MRLLVTGFSPFQGESINPSALVLPQIQRRLPQFQIETRVLPVEYDRASSSVLRDFAKFDGVLCLGQAAGRSLIGLERLAVNLQDAEIPDEAGHVRRESAVVAEGPDAILNPMPLGPLVQALKQEGLPVEVSNSAGTYVCNSLYYALLLKNRILAQNKEPKPRWILFVHVPKITEQRRSGLEEPTQDLSVLVATIESLFKKLVSSSP